MIRSIEELVEKALNDMLMDLEEVVRTGRNVEDYAEYQFLIGKIEGISRARTAVIDVLHRYDRGEDD